jgi:hypothetical protein
MTENNGPLTPAQTLDHWGDNVTIGSGIVPYTYVITKRIKTVVMSKDGGNNTKGQQCIYFVYTDGTKSTASPVATCNTDTGTFSFAMCYNFIGLDCNLGLTGSKTIVRFGTC